MKESKILDKIRALMAKTIENGASENEMEQALIMARNLMAKQRLGLDKLMNGFVEYKDCREAGGIFYDIVCTQTGSVFGFSTSLHSNENEFYAANEFSLNAFKSNLKIEIYNLD